MTTETAKTNPVLWWALFLSATWLMSVWFKAFGAFTHSPTAGPFLGLLGMTLLLAANLLILVYDSYAKEKRKGAVKNTIRLFEWMYRKQYPSEPSSSSTSTLQKGDAPCHPAR
jgi:hypothetical protein